MKVLIDMNLSPRWVEVLTRAGFAADHWSSLGPRDAPDQEIMAYARSNGYVVLTHDLDFGAILAAAGGDKPSVVQVRAADISAAVIAGAVIGALQQMAGDLDRGCSQLTWVAFGCASCLCGRVRHNARPGRLGTNRSLRSMLPGSHRLRIKLSILLRSEIIGQRKAWQRRQPL
jgi:predicted nuclease of predicted toxin-antitoxin system